MENVKKKITNYSYGSNYSIGFVYLNSVIRVKTNIYSLTITVIGAVRLGQGGGTDVSVYFRVFLLARHKILRPGVYIHVYRASLKNGFNGRRQNRIYDILLHRIFMAFIIIICVDVVVIRVQFYCRRVRGAGMQKN